MNNILKLIISVTIPLAIGALGSYFTIPQISNWYQSINKPSWSPPNWIFGPV
jgi:translocator protein